MEIKVTADDWYLTRSGYNEYDPGTTIWSQSREHAPLWLVRRKWSRSVIGWADWQCYRCVPGPDIWISQHLIRMIQCRLSVTWTDLYQYQYIQDNEDPRASWSIVKLWSEAGLFINYEHSLIVLYFKFVLSPHFLDWKNNLNPKKSGDGYVIGGLSPKIIGSEGLYWTFYLIRTSVLLSQ